MPLRDFPSGSTLWFLAYFPRSEEVKQRAEARIAAGESEEEVRSREEAEQVRQSVAGRMGLAIAPALEPLGFDWKIGIGIISSFAARETLFSALGVVYGVGEVDETSTALREQLRRPGAGRQAVHLAHRRLAHGLLRAGVPVHVHARRS